LVPISTEWKFRLIDFSKVFIILQLNVAGSDYVFNGEIMSYSFGSKDCLKEFIIPMMNDMSMSCLSEFCCFSKACDRELAKWLWSTLIQLDLNKLKEQFNAHRVRYDHKKFLPSGISPMEAMARHQEFGATDCLVPVNIELIQHLKEALGGEELLRFVDTEFAAHCESVYDSLGSPLVTFVNAWEVFSEMLPHVFEDTD